MVTMNISLNKELAEIVEYEVKHKKYANRSEFFRDLIRKQYIENDLDIEYVDKDDPDYKLAQKLKKNAEYVDESQIFDDI